MHATVLNNYIENRKLLIKLTDWLVSRRNRKVTREIKGKRRCLEFKAFTLFINPEAEFLCNPIFSVKEAAAASRKTHQVKKSKEVGKLIVHSVKNIEENTKKPKL